MTSTNKPDYWSLLGLSPGSNSIEVRQAFKKEAMRWHPDLNMNNKNAEERFKWINEAYKVLSDPQKRTAYDQFGHAGVKQNGSSSNEFNGQGFGNIFGDIKCILKAILVS